MRAGKYMEIRFDDEDEAIASGKVKEMCDRLLANPVVEQYRFELEEVQRS